MQHEASMTVQKGRISNIKSTKMASIWNYKSDLLILEVHILGTCVHILTKYEVSVSKPVVRTGVHRCQHCPWWWRCRTTHDEQSMIVQGSLVDKPNEPKTRINLSQLFPWKKCLCEWFWRNKKASRSKDSTAYSCSVGAVVLTVYFAALCLLIFKHQFNNAASKIGTLFSLDRA